MASLIFEIADALAWGFFRQAFISTLAWCVIGMTVGCICSKTFRPTGQSHIFFATDMITLGWIATLVYSTRLAVSLRHVLRGARQFMAPDSVPALDHADHVLNSLKGPQAATASTTTSLTRFVAVASTLYGLADAHFERAMGHAAVSILHDIVVERQRPPPRSGVKLLEKYVRDTKKTLKDQQQEETHARQSMKALHDMFEEDKEE